jgi:hypothetical protein
LNRKDRKDRKEKSWQVFALQEVASPIPQGLGLRPTALCASPGKAQSMAPCGESKRSSGNVDLFAVFAVFVVQFLPSG